MCTEQYQQDLNNRMDYLIQQILTLKKRVDSFMDEMQRRDKETVEYCKKEMNESRIKIQKSRGQYPEDLWDDSRVRMDIEEKERNHENQIPA